MTKALSKEEALKLRAQYLSLHEISANLNISKSTASLWLRDHPLPDHVIKERQLPSQQAFLQRLADRRRAPMPSKTYKNISSTKRGKAAELLFIAACLLAGYDCYVPVTEDGRVDVILGRKLLIRVQVKIISETGRYITLCKINHSGRHTKKYNYTTQDIDFFVGVDLSSKDIYVIPSHVWTRYKSNVGINVLERLGCKNNLDLLENQVDAGIEPAHDAFAAHSVPISPIDH